MEQFIADDFLTFTVGILVFFAGMRLNRRFQVLRKYNIPEPVTGGLLAAALFFGIFTFAGTEVVFAMGARDQLLVYFFTAIGLNARLSDLIRGGRPLLILLVLTLTFIVIQNVVGFVGASLVGLPKAVGILAGSTSLIGGHGTAIAWAPEVAAQGIDNALEIGVACATLGLVMASLVGGPIARFLLQRHQLSGDSAEAPIVGIAHEDADQETLNHISLMSALLTLHIAIILGYIMNQAVVGLGFKLPLFVSCLLVAIVLSNTIPLVFPSAFWPVRTKSLALISDFSLGLFLAISLMSMQLWAIAELAGPLLILLFFQTMAAIVFILFVLFPLMGKDYQAAVLSAGFGGFALGATPTAIANMTAVTKSHGPAPTAFLILPLVAAFFVDLMNAFVIRFALTL